ncbi:MAG: inositol monophosphatase [Pseudonocardiales bacterium]|nr:MAG: inositol monophosphatase [Pseudonocardiales bacterium]
MDEAQDLVESVRAVHVRIRDAVIDAMVNSTSEEMRLGDGSGGGDTIYGIDRAGEAVLLEMLGMHLEKWLPVVVVAEGLPDIGVGPGTAVLPPGASPSDARFWVIVDPIDGTRGLMYGKRSAWILTGISPIFAGRTPSLRDIEVAVQTEIPHPKQTLADTLWAVRGEGATAIRTDLRTGISSPLPLTPSAADSIGHGFGQVARVFPGGRDVLAAIDDEVCLAVVGPGGPGKGVTFEDQYISTGGQLAELAFGHDRWTADLRPLLTPVLAKRGLPPPQCCHPYDICTALIAEEAGVLVVGPKGPLDHPLTLDDNVTWFGYANESIRALVEPALLAAITAYLGPP